MYYIRCLVFTKLYADGAFTLPQKHARTHPSQLQRDGWVSLPLPRHNMLDAADKRRGMKVEKSGHVWM